MVDQTRAGTFEGIIVIVPNEKFAALILIGCTDVKQLRLANENLRIPFQCQSWREFVLAHFVVL